MGGRRVAVAAVQNQREGMIKVFVSAAAKYKPQRGISPVTIWDVRGGILRFSETSRKPELLVVIVEALGGSKHSFAPIMAANLATGIGTHQLAWEAHPLTAPRFEVMSRYRLWASSLLQFEDLCSFSICQ